MYKALHCKPGDLIEYVRTEKGSRRGGGGDLLHVGLATVALKDRYFMAAKRGKYEWKPFMGSSAPHGLLRLYKSCARCSARYDAHMFYIQNGSNFIKLKIMK
jgi:hypothetical protein